MSDEETVAAVRANYEHGRGATFEETEVLFRALDAAERERDAARAERDEARATSESWRKAHVAWQQWAGDLLKHLRMQPEHGALGDASARDALRTRLAIAEKVVEAAREFLVRTYDAQLYERDGKRLVAMEQALAALDANAGSGT